MGTKYIFMFTFLAVQVLCDQKNSLTFVIDDTSSMYDDISQVRSAAKSIIDIVLNEKSSQIEDIVVVTFNDPTFGFRHRTRNEVELKQALDRIHVHEGGDCEEMSLSGIKVALEESQPGSYLFVFSDASAKDYRKFNEIKALCQEKQSQIVFVLTGDCGSLSSPDSQVYYKIAAASNGQVFRISKGEVGQVLEYVKETIKGDKTVITSKVVPPNKWYAVHFNIDDKTEYALVSASGFNVQLKVRNQFNKELGGIEVTWTKNVKALKLVGLRPGAYKAFVHGSSDVNVMIFGRTDFNFNFGFSNKTENSLKYTEAQPTQGTATHLIISVKDDEHSVNIQNVEILDMNERVIQRLPLTSVGGSVYATTKFLPPNAMFKVAVTATARRTGKAIRRIANTPVEPIKPVVVAPEISDTEKILKAKEGEKINIHCRIRRGKPKPHITWYFRQRGASQFKLLPGKTDDVLPMNNVLVRDTGDYQCVVENIAGRATHILQLEVFGLPAFEKSPSVLEVRQSANLDIQCKIRSGNPPPAITWQFKTSETGEFHIIDNFGERLRIFNVQQSNSGFYKCEAKNNIGTAQQITQVIVLVNPEFEDTPAKIMEKENKPVTLKCKLRKGNPRPKITWYFQASGSKIFTTLSNSGEELRLPAVQLKDSGEYRCVAENSAGRDERTMTVTVLAAPGIERSTPSIIRVKENTTISIPCRLSNGFPKPTITWWYMDANSTEYVAIPDSNADFLHLEHIQLTKAGHYKCVARNTVGHTDKDVQIIVEAPARIVFIPPNSPFYEGVEGDVVMRLPCTAVGFPKPSVSWIVDQDVVGKDKSRSLYVEDDVFYLKNPQRFNSSNYSKNITHTYVCHAVNDFGKDKQSYEVTVLQYADYESNNTDEKYAEAKKPYDLNCPLPYTDPNSVRWFYDSTIMNKTGPILHFDDPTRANSGNYTCRVSDLNGAASYTIELKFDYPPSVSRLVYEAEWNGNEEEITCNAEILYGKYEWFYRGVKVKEAYADKLELSLIGWGQYVCRVTNPLGTLNITYNIHAKDCIIEKILSKTKNLPLVLDMSLAWPTFHRQNQYQIIPKSEKLTLICQDDWPKSKIYSQSESNSFMKFPNTKSIIATCDHEDLFLVDGVSYKLSELDCKHEVSSSVVPIKECLGSDTTMMSVGFNVNGFLDVYKSCLDTKRNVVLYTEVITTGADQFGYTDKPERPCESIEECCYESVQLVNAADVSAGPAEKATFRKPLNTVSYCKPNDENTTSWHDIETKVREKASQSRLMIWSGTVNFTTVDKLLVPQYLWKVVKDLDNEEILTIVHSNEQAPQAASLCENVCQKSWFEPYGPRTYCCRLQEFKKVFNLTINF
ncbi:hemicentin-1-like [Choristoneura fumiferana]|uniref:hemicentin-1-like n=1 Tax=Choristoneura fumiferana TaxID=7141 RepID=UPI003D158FAA